MSKIKCPNCGNTVPEGSTFCNRCGSRITTDDFGSNKDYADDWSTPASKLEQRQNKNKSSKGRGYTIYALIALAAIGFSTLVYCTRCTGNDRSKQTLSTVDESAAEGSEETQTEGDDGNTVITPENAEDYGIELTEDQTASVTLGE